MARQIKSVSCVLAIALSLGVVLGTYSSQIAARTAETVWRWSPDCREGKELGLEVLLDGKSIYNSSLTICRMRSDEVRPTRAAQTIIFPMKGGHTFHGQRRTTPGETVEGNIWQAGAEPDALLLGISFSTDHQVLMNAVHVARPNVTSKSKLDPGLVFRTYPIPRSRRPSARR